jgi:hypothetical protein
MNRPRRHRYRAAGALSLAIAMGLLAAVGALAGIAVAKDGSHRSEKRHGHHGRHHHQPSGTIQSFDSETGRLTIVLLNEETASGLVTDRTRIKCEDEHSPDITASRTHLRHGEEEPGDDRGGRGEEEPGDDHGGHGEEPGDDHGRGSNSGPGNSNSAGGSGPSGHDDNGAGANCTTSDLIVGAVVTDAELEIEHGGATWDEVELAS